MPMYPCETAQRFKIDPTPRRADGQYVAHARIYTVDPDGRATEVHWSGDLAGFFRRADAVAYAQEWAHRWLDDPVSL